MLFQGMTMSDYRNVAFNAVAAAVALALAGGAHTASAQSSQRDDVIEEIITTATKREASVQDISVSVTALGEEQLRLGGIDDISRLEHLVPGMRFGQSGNEVRLAMRGTRTNNVGTEAEQVVGIFEDGVYVPTTTQALGTYVDINRIEVLRGPQGTLYGRNTFGGTINIITNEPQFDSVHGHVSALYGDYDRVRLEGVVNLPVSDTFAVRLAGLSDIHDGYIENINDPSDDDDLQDQDIQYFRATAKWAPTDTFDATLRLAVSDKDTNGSAIWGYQQIGGYVDGMYLPGHNFAPPNASADFDQGPYRVRRDFASTADTESVAATLTLNWELEPVTLKLIGNTTDFEGRQISDFDYSDGGDPLNSGFAGWDSEQDTWSTELQILSNADSALEWMLGFYYYDQASNWNWLDVVDGAPKEPSWDNQGDYISDSTGYFGHATYSVSDTVRLIGGLRHAKDSKKQRDTWDWSIPAIVPGSGIEGEWTKTLWKAGVEVDVNDDVMAYGVASTGYRAGGINFIAEGVPLTYEPEEVTAYEVGMKSTLADDRVQLNVAAYLNRYRDMHAQSFIFLPGSTAVSEFTENGGEVDAQGLEVELRWIPGENWNISANLALMDAEFGEYNISKVAGLGDLGGRQDLDDPTKPLLSLKGWRPALSPEVTFGAQIGYDFRLAGGSVFTPFVQTTYTSKYSGHDINVPGQFQDAHTKSDIRLIWTSANSKTQIQAFVLNVEDEAVLNRVVVFNPGARPELASLQAHWNMPRTWGISAAFNFE